MSGSWRVPVNQHGKDVAGAPTALLPPPRQDAATGPDHSRAAWIGMSRRRKLYSDGDIIRFWIRFRSELPLTALLRKPDWKACRGRLVHHRLVVPLFSEAL